MDVSDSEEKRKAAAGELIRKYYYQLTVGCGKTNCDNPNCASSGPSSLSPNDAAAQAILCVKVRSAVLVIVISASPLTFLQAKNVLCPLPAESENDERAENREVAEEGEEAMEVCSEGGGGVAGGGGGGGGINTTGCSLAAGPSGLNVQAPPFCPRQTKGN